MKARFTAGGMIKQINEVFEKNANNSLRDKGLTMSQFRVLLLLNFNSEGMLTLKEIVNGSRADCETGGEKSGCRLYRPDGQKDSCNRHNRKGQRILRRGQITYEAGRKRDFESFDRRGKETIYDLFIEDRKRY